MSKKGKLPPKFNGLSMVIIILRSTKMFGHSWVSFFSGEHPTIFGQTNLHPKHISPKLLQERHHSGLGHIGGSQASAWTSCEIFGRTLLVGWVKIKPNFFMFKLCSIIWTLETPEETKTWLGTIKWSTGYWNDTENNNYPPTPADSRGSASEKRVKRQAASSRKP